MTYGWKDYGNDLLGSLRDRLEPAASVTSFPMAGLVFGLSRGSWAALGLLLITDAGAFEKVMFAMAAGFFTLLLHTMTVQGWAGRTRHAQAVERLEREHGYLER